MVYAFESTDFKERQWLLAWNGNIPDGGYFWVQKPVFYSCIYSGYDKHPHKFTFKNKRSAINLAKSINLQNYKIVSFRNEDMP